MKNFDNKIIKTVAVMTAATFITACDSTNAYLSKKTETSEMYRIFDLKTSASVDKIGKAAIEGLTYSIPTATSTHSIQTEIPDEPPAMKITNPLKGTSFAKLASLSGQGSTAFKTMDCEDAVYSLSGHKEVTSDSTIKIQVCVFPYKEGYRVNEYAVLTKESGGLFQISRIGAHALVGTPEEWTEKVLLDVVRNIKKNNADANIAFIEGYPDISGTPWLDLQSDIKIANVD